MSAEPARKMDTSSGDSSEAAMRLLETVDPPFLNAVKSNIQTMLLSDNLEMPRMSSLATRILEIASDPNVDVDKVVDLVQADAFLAGKILSLMNSAYFATRQEITSLRHAIVLLGLRSVGDLIFGVSVKMTVFKCPAYDKLMAKLWEHSVGVAVATEVIAQMKGGGGVPGFMGGLMHDIGKPIVLASIVDAEAARKRKPIGQAAAALLIDRMHGHVGSLLAKKWKLSADVRGAIQSHSTWSDDAEPLAQYVYCGNKVAHHLGLGYKQVDLTAGLDPGLTAVGLSDADLPRIFTAVEEHAGRLMRTF